MSRIAWTLMLTALVIPDESSYLSFSPSGDVLLFYLLSKLHERTSTAITTNLSFADWASMFADTRMTKA